MKDNKVYNVVLDQERDWQIYRALYKAEIEKEYTYQNTMRLALDSTTYGP